MKVRFPDGTVVQARGLLNLVPTKGDGTPSWAVYLEKEWLRRPLPWHHEFFDWPDSGLPRNEEALFELVLTTKAHITGGEVVEIACLGGWGRTGTFVACLSLVSGVSTAKAVEWTREHYVPDAIETQEQVAMIHRFSQWLSADMDRPE